MSYPEYNYNKIRDYIRKHSEPLHNTMDREVIEKLKNESEKPTDLHTAFMIFVYGYYRGAKEQRDKEKHN